MKKPPLPSKKRFAFVGLLAMLFVHPMNAADNVDPSGTWRWEYEWQGETIKDSLRLNLSDEGKVIGTFHGRNSTKPIKNGKIEKDQLSFDFELDFNGVTVGLKFSGTIKQDNIDGNVVLSANGEENEFPWNPKRSVQLADVIGKWQFRIETRNGNVLEPKLEIVKDGDSVKGNYIGQSGRELEVKKIEVKDNHLSFTVAADRDGTHLKVDYKGRPYGDKIAGKLNFDFGGQTGELEFTGKRNKPAAKK